MTFFCAAGGLVTRAIRPRPDELLHDGEAWKQGSPAGTYPAGAVDTSLGPPTPRIILSMHGRSSPQKRQPTKRLDTGR